MNDIQPFYFKIIVVDKDGDTLISEDDNVGFGSDRDHPIGDELDVYYTVERAGRRYASLKIERRRSFIVQPRSSLRGGLVGGFTTLICTPTAKNGGRKSVEGLRKYYRENR